MEHLEGPDSSIPIAVGADRPAKGLYSHAYHVHGSDGLGISLPTPTLKPHHIKAVEFLRDSISASPGELTLIAIGPLTNVAAALDNRPDIADAIPEIIVMGGAVGVRGNITPHAEFNIHEDPWAANAVFESGSARHARRTRRDAPDLHAPRRGPEDGSEGDSKSAQLGNRILVDRFQELEGDDEFHLARSPRGGGGNRAGHPVVPLGEGVGGDGRGRARTHDRKLWRGVPSWWRLGSMSSVADGIVRSVISQ